MPGPACAKWQGACVQEPQRVLVPSPPRRQELDGLLAGPGALGYVETLDQEVDIQFYSN